MISRSKGKHSRWAFVLESLVKQLRTDVPGFSLEPLAVQVALANMVWVGAIKRRRHIAYTGYMSFHHWELKAWFGGRFKEINARLGFFEVKEAWWAALDGRKSTTPFTKGYRFSSTVQACRIRFLASESHDVPTRLLSSDGTAVLTPPNAVSCKDTAGVTTTRWRSANQASVLNQVPVNIEALQQLHRDLEQRISASKGARCTLQGMEPYRTRLDHLLELRDNTAQIICMAKTHAAGWGRVMHQYTESGSGRLYAGGVSLQNAPVVIRQAALSGLWDYDAENCHFAICAQMARRADFQCHAIEHYMANKGPIRAEIANVIGISINQTKTCLLAVMYGARTTTWHENAIPQAIGEDAAKRLYVLPQFADIVADVKLARATILGHFKLNRQGWLVNDFGKSVKAAERTAEQLLAHLIQGVEALALLACTELHPREIVLLQHDGFTARRQLDVTALSEAIYKATGYQFTMSEKRAYPDLDAQLAKESEREFSRVQRLLNPSTGAVYSPILLGPESISSVVPCLPSYSLLTPHRNSLSHRMAL